MPEFKRWDQYVAEAAHEDFLLPVSDEHTIRVRTPTGGQVIAMQRALAEGGDVEQQLRIICGDAADELLPLVKAAPAQVMNELVTDIMRHFGFDAATDAGEASASSG
jgi:hypothetical protein